MNKKLRMAIFLTLSLMLTISLSSCKNSADEFWKLYDKAKSSNSIFETGHLVSDIDIYIPGYDEDATRRYYHSDAMWPSDNIPDASIDDLLDWAEGGKSIVFNVQQLNESENNNFHICINKREKEIFNSYVYSDNDSVYLNAVDMGLDNECLEGNKYIKYTNEETRNDNSLKILMFFIRNGKGTDFYQLLELFKPLRENFTKYISKDTETKSYMLNINSSDTEIIEGIIRILEDNSNFISQIFNLSELETVNEIALLGNLLKDDNFSIKISVSSKPDFILITENFIINGSSLYSEIKAYTKSSNIRVSIPESIDYESWQKKFNLWIDKTLEYMDRDIKKDDVESETKTSSVETMGQRNALESAKRYLSVLPFSYSGLIEQLEYEKYSHEDATYAADNCGADWDEEAAKKAKAYLLSSSFSRDGLIGQLEYEGFTHSQAVYGVEANGY